MALFVDISSSRKYWNEKRNVQHAVLWIIHDGFMGPLDLLWFTCDFKRQFFFFLNVSHTHTIKYLSRCLRYVFLASPHHGGCTVSVRIRRRLIHSTLSRMGRGITISPTSHPLPIIPKIILHCSLSLHRFPQDLTFYSTSSPIFCCSYFTFATLQDVLTMI